MCAVMNEETCVCSVLCGGLAPCSLQQHRQCGTRFQLAVLHADASSSGHLVRGSHR